MTQLMTELLYCTLLQHHGTQEGAMRRTTYQNITYKLCHYPYSLGLQTGTGFIGPDRAGPGPGPIPVPVQRLDRKTGIFFYVKSELKKIVKKKHKVVTNYSY